MSVLVEPVRVHIDQMDRLVIETCAQVHTTGARNSDIKGGALLSYLVGRDRAVHSSGLSRLFTNVSCIVREKMLP